MKLFIGTNFGHGSSTAALNDKGKLIYAVEEGHFIGKKNCDDFPDKSLQRLFEDFTPNSTQWAEGWKQWARFIHKGVEPTVRYGIFDSSYFKARLVKETKRLFTGLRAQARRSHFLRTPIFVGHHLAHAFSLIPWGLPTKSIVVVSDTTAESASISIFYWSGREMTLLLEVPYPHSLGAAFHGMAYHLGFYGRTGPGKLMALSAYGEPKWLDELNAIYSITDKGFRFDLGKYPAWNRKGAWEQFALKTASPSLRAAIKKSYGCFEQGIDLARSIQEFFTVASLNIIKDALRVGRKKHGLEVKHLGLAGGTALNCSTNGHIIRSLTLLGVKSLTVSPWSDDPGTAVGSAAWLYFQKTKKIPQPIANTFIGPLVDESSRNEIVSSRDIESAAEVLRDGGIIALVSGRMEFGPRALGNRCLLGDPRNPSVNRRLNIIKKRPQFMPFAPVVLTKDFNTYFHGKGSANMAWTVKSRDGAQTIIPGAIHVNGESRVQVLDENSDTLLSKLLLSFRNLTGIGVLLLTSLNGNNEPIPIDLTTAKQIVTQMNIDGLLSDFGWQEPVNNFV